MEIQAAGQLSKIMCQPCEGGVKPFSLQEAKQQVSTLEGWYLSHGGKRIRNDWSLKHLMSGLDSSNRLAHLAEDDGHHPNLHVEG